MDVQYPSLPKLLTIEHILKCVLGRKFNPDEDLYYEDYMDLLEAALYQTFYDWYAHKVRIEQRNI